MSFPSNAAVAAVMTASIALLVGEGWIGLLIGAGYAGALALGTWIGSAPRTRQWRLVPRAYARSAAVATGLGALTWWLAGADNASFFGVGVVAAIALSTGVAGAADDADPRRSQDADADADTGTRP